MVLEILRLGLSTSFRMSARGSDDHPSADALGAPIAVDYALT